MMILFFNHLSINKNELWMIIFQFKSVKWPLFYPLFFPPKKAKKEKTHLRGLNSVIATLFMAENWNSLPHMSGYKEK